MNDLSHHGVLVFLKASQNSVECETAFWYLIAKGDLDFEFVHRATPPLFAVNFIEGCSPSFVFMSTFSRHFGTNSNIERWTEVDPLFSVSVNDFKATNILNDGSILIYSTDKSWLRVRPEDSQDDWANFKKSRESFKAMGRGRTKTVSSKGQFVLSAVLDEDKKNVYLVTVPNAVSKGLKIIGVSTDDFMTNTEYKIKYSGKPEDMEVTDGFIKDHVYYGLSRTTNTVIKVDLASHEVIGTFGIDTNGAEVLSIEEKGVGSYYLLVRKGPQLSLQEVQVQ